MLVLKDEEGVDGRVAAVEGSEECKEMPRSPAVEGEKSSRSGGGGGWSRTLLKFGLVIVAYSIVMGAIFNQILEENQLDMVIRKRIPDVL